MQPVRTELDDYNYGRRKPPPRPPPPKSKSPSNYKVSSISNILNFLLYRWRTYVIVSVTFKLFFLHDYWHLSINYFFLYLTRITVLFQGLSLILGKDAAKRTKSAATAVVKPLPAAPVTTGTLIDFDSPSISPTFSKLSGDLSSVSSSDSSFNYQSKRFVWIFVRYLSCYVRMLFVLLIRTVLEFS